MIISTPDGDVELKGKDKDDFLSSLPGEVVFEETRTLEEKIADGLKATGMTTAQISAFLASVSK